MDEPEEKRITIEPLPETKKKAAKTAAIVTGEGGDVADKAKKKLSDKKMAALGKATYVKNEYIRLGKQLYHDRLNGKTETTQTVDNGSSDIIKRMGDLEGLLNKLDERLSGMMNSGAQQPAEVAKLSPPPPNLDIKLGTAVNMEAVAKPENVIQEKQTAPTVPTELRQEAIEIPRESYHNVESRTRYKERIPADIADRYDPPVADVRTNYILF